MAAKKYKTETHTMPVIWASALINDDYSGLDDSDIKEMESYVTDIKGLCISADTDNIDFRNFNGVGHEVCEYTYIIK